jgi:hypothetical protein
MAVTDGVHSAQISAASSGDNTIVSAVVGRSIRVLGYVMVADAAVTARWYDGPSSDSLPLSGAMSFADNGGAVAAPAITPQPAGGIGWFKTRPGKALVLNLGGATGVRGHVLYELR